MKKNNLFICSLVDILDCAEKEKNAILDGKESLWNLEQIQKVIVPEISELLSYAIKVKFISSMERNKDFWNHHI